MTEQPGLGGENELEAVLRTLQDFDVIPAGATGAVLFSERQRVTTLPSNLRAAAQASALGLSSVDYARRLYPVVESELERRPVVEAFVDACAHARSYRSTATHNLQSTTTEASRKVPIGVAAASIALQRLESGFLAAQLLYRVGLNLEADTVARQVLEQIAWAVAVVERKSRKDIEDLQPQTTIGSLTRLLPAVGPLNGELSKVAHAGHRVHRTLVRIGDGRDQVVMAEERLSRAARTIATLTDAWVIAFEFSQRNFVAEFLALSSVDAPEPNPSRKFVPESAERVAAVVRYEKVAASE